MTGHVPYINKREIWKTSSPEHVTISMQTNDDPSEKPTTYVEPPPKNKIPPKPSQNTETSNRKPITALRMAFRSQGGEIPLAPNQLKPHLIISLNIAERGHLRIWILRMYQSFTNQSPEYITYHQNDTLILTHISLFSPLSPHG